MLREFNLNEKKERMYMHVHKYTSQMPPNWMESSLYTQ